LLLYTNIKQLSVVATSTYFNAEAASKKHDSLPYNEEFGKRELFPNPSG
jgi:hypothetical protein